MIDPTQVEKIYADLGLSVRVKHRGDGPRFSIYTVDCQRDTTLSRVMGRSNDLSARLGLAGVSLFFNRSELLLLIPQAPSPEDALQIYARCPPETEGDILVGLDIWGRPVFVNLNEMPHGLIAGTTGSGKSVALHNILCNLMATHTPQELQLLLIDTKRVEFVRYAGVPFLLSAPAYNGHMALELIDWLRLEMRRRYSGGANAGPRIVLVIEEFADLVVNYPGVTQTIVELAQLARAARIHILIATQRPSVNVVPGVLKANLPTRLVLRVASGVDSKVALDATGAEHLLGHGDALLSYNGATTRLQVPYAGQVVLAHLRQHFTQHTGG